MGLVLGKMGHLLQSVEGEWGEAIPHIQSLVVNKAGANRGLPDDGIKEFWPDYPRLSRSEKHIRAKIEYQNILAFGSRWNDVLEKLSLQKLTIDSGEAARRGIGKGGESENHKKLKEFIRQHPELVGADKGWDSYVEYPLPSLDEIDVVFKSTTDCIAVEVKSSVSDGYPDDYQRGLYQTIKYGALLAAMAKHGRYGIPRRIRSILLLESRLPEEYRKVAQTLKVEVIECIKVTK